MKRNIPAKFCAACALALLVVTAGCGSKNTSADEDAQMKNAIQGKGVGAMPADVKEKMDAAMKAHSTSGNGAAK